MPRYFPVPLDFEPWTGSNQPVFREKTATTFDVDQIKQNATAEGSERQAFFEGQLARMNSTTVDGRIPVFTKWNDGVKRRMDLGCIGHALARGIIEKPVNDRVLKYVTHIRLKS